MRDGLAWDPDLDTPLARYGHKQCVVQPRLVPGNQAWLWDTASASTNYQVMAQYFVRFNSFVLGGTALIKKNAG